MTDKDDIRVGDVRDLRVKVTQILVPSPSPGPVLAVLTTVPHEGQGQPGWVTERVGLDALKRASVLVSRKAIEPGDEVRVRPQDAAMFRNLPTAVGCVVAIANGNAWVEWPAANEVVAIDRLEPAP